MKVSSAVPEAPAAKKNNFNPGSNSESTLAQHIKVVANKTTLHRPPSMKNPHDQGEKIFSKLSRGYEELIAGLTPKQFATMEASCGDKNSPLEVLATLSLVAPDQFKIFLEGVFRRLPKSVKSKASSAALAATKLFAKISGVRVAEPKAHHYAARPTTAGIRTTIREDFKQAKAA